MVFEWETLSISASSSGFFHKSGDGVKCDHFVIKSDQSTLVTMSLFDLANEGVDHKYAQVPVHKPPVIKGGRPVVCRHK